MQKALDGLERSGILVSRTVGSTREYEFNPRYAMRDELRALLEKALYWLNKAVDYGSFETTYLAFRPDFDVLRDDPRYQQLLERVYGDRGPRSRAMI